MYSGERRSANSPTPSRGDSYREGPSSRPAGRSSITEDDREDNEYEQTPYNGDEPPVADRPPPQREEQYKAALQYRFPNRPKTDIAYTRPPILANAETNPATRPTTTTTPAPPAPPAPSANSGPYQSILRPNNRGGNTANTSEERTFAQPRLRPVNPEQQNTYARRTVNETTTPSQSKITTPGANVRINEPDNNINRPTSTYPWQSQGPIGQQSTFETVPSHGGPVSYLGTGTFSQFEHCLHECLNRERQQTGFASHIVRHDMPPNMSIHDSVSVPPHQVFQSSDNHNFIDYPSRSYGTFSLDDVRSINVALSRSGISLFPHHRPYHDSYSDSYSSPSLFDRPLHSPYPSSYGGSGGGRRIIGEVVSACRLVEEDQPLSYNRHATEAVQNVWNAIQHHQPFSHMDPSRSSVLSRGPYDI